MSTFVIVFLWHVLNSYAFRFCYCIINAVFRTKDCLFPEFSAFQAVLPVFKFVCVYCGENCRNISQHKVFFYLLSQYIRALYFAEARGRL